MLVKFHPVDLARVNWKKVFKIGDVIIIPEITIALILSIQRIFSSYAREFRTQ
jgi:hypothetical protein